MNLLPCVMTLQPKQRCIHGSIHDAKITLWTTRHSGARPIFSRDDGTKSWVAISRGIHVRFGNFVHTLMCCTQIFLVYMHCAYTSHSIMSVTHMHGSRVSAVRMSSSLFHFAFSLLMFRPFLVLLFFDGHFETTPDCDFDDL